MMQRVLTAQDSLLEIPGIGPAIYFKLKEHNLQSVADLLRVYPLRYEDYRQHCGIAALIPEETVTITAQIIKTKNIYTRKRNFTIQTVTVEDASGKIDLVWFNQPYIIKSLPVGAKYRFSGKVVEYRGNLTLNVAQFEPADNPPLHTANLVPIYSESYGVSSKFLRQKIHYLLDHFQFSSLTTPIDNIDLKTKLPSVEETLLAIHRPQNQQQLVAAQERLLLIELLRIKLLQLAKFRKLATAPYIQIKMASRLKEQFLKALPFQLTSSQTTVFKEIENDLENNRYLNRLLMGDVGSGKTIIMAYLAYLFALSNERTVILVPTEALARQHQATLNKLLSPFSISAALLTAKNRQSFEKSRIIVGTQALFYRSQLPPFALLIVDEQHKFGVKDREQLLNVSSSIPHLLTVSATPIPRSLAQSLYGEVTTSYLREKPFSTQVKTYLVPNEKRAASYDWIAKQINEHPGTQVFVICPAIENQSDDNMSELKTVVEEAERLQTRWQHLRIGSVYSRHRQKNQILDAYKKGDLDILVSTSLIEVGIDIPAASIMLIENAERFGLSQLHQMRGRIGRRGQLAYCLLFTNNRNPETLKRLRYLERTQDAFMIAEADLKLRGPGNLLGTEQHGFSFITLENLLDENLNERVNELAQQLLAKSESIDYTNLLAKINY